MVGLVAARVVLDGVAATAEEDGEDEEEYDEDGACGGGEDRWEFVIHRRWFEGEEMVFEMKYEKERDD